MGKSPCFLSRGWESRSAMACCACSSQLSMTFLRFLRYSIDAYCRLLVLYLLSDEKVSFLMSYSMLLSDNWRVLVRWK